MDLLSINVNANTEKKNAELVAFLLGGEWRSHPLHERYFFSRSGHAASISKRGSRHYVRLLKGCTAGQQQYRAVSYPLGGGLYGRLYIHRAVCELFIGPQPSPGLQVRHLDCNKFNNAASNLAWGTAADNAKDGVKAGKIKRGEESPNARLTRADADAMRELRAINGMTYKEIGAMFGVARMTAHRLINGAIWK